MIDTLKNPEALEKGIADVRQIFGMDDVGRRGSTEVSLMRIITDIMNSKPSDWPVPMPAGKLAPVPRFLQIVKALLGDKCGLFHDQVAYKPVGTKGFTGIRFYGQPMTKGAEPYHILNLSYVAIEAWFKK